MKVSRVMLFLAVVCIALSAGSLSATAAADKKKAAVKSDLTSDLVANLTRTGKQLVSLAEATPAEKFSWRPNDAVRRISEVYMHVVGPNMLLPSLLGAAPPKGMTIPASEFDTEVEAFGFPASKRAYLLILLSHAHEHLGQSIAYARSIGVVPPWSAPKDAAAGKSGQ